MTSIVIQEASTFDEELLRLLVKFIIQNLDPNCDTAGTKAALSGLAENQDRGSRLTEYIALDVMLLVVIALMLFV